MPDQTLFLTLRIFSATGGIEKVSRVAGKAMQELANGHAPDTLKIFSMYDEQEDVNEKYFPALIFRGFAKKKSQFVYAAIKEGIKSRQVILSHSNLLLAGFLIKLFSPKTKLVLLAHGIEVWYRFPSWKKYMLQQCDLVLAVSRYTKATMVAQHGLDENKVTVLNNCLDPFLEVPFEARKNALLLERYGLTEENMVLITLTRLSSKEQYKGYENVLYAIKELKQQYPLIRYLVVGKYDTIEKQRVDNIVTELALEDNVIFTGFIPDEEIAAHYNIADLYIMPSKKEGFGIVFIEAMYYGKPVIGGNKDGSVDALDNGNFGLLIDPDDRKEIAGAIVKVISNKPAFTANQQEVLKKFSYPAYKENLRLLLGGT
ncbi:MAG: glycosyltransferase family 4 protein [Ferruginibacter sp.]